MKDRIIRTYRNIESKIEKSRKRTREIYEFVKLDPLERIKRAGSDYLAITLPNTLVLGNLEQHVGEYFGSMDARDSADMRLWLSPTNPVLGLVRDVERHIDGVDKINDRKKSKMTDFKVFAQVAGIELGFNLIKYIGLKKIKGQPVNLIDIVIPALSAAYTLRGYNLFGRTIETFRDGFNLDKGNNHDSYLDPRMTQEDKRRRVVALSIFTVGALMSYWISTR